MDEAELSPGAGTLLDVENVVYVPCVAPADPAHPLELVCPTPLPDVVVVAVWSSLAALVSACGEDQPWVAVPLAAAAGLRDDAGALAVVLDPPSLAASWS